jgi:hypothetical protein
MRTEVTVFHVAALMGATVVAYAGVAVTHVADDSDRYAVSGDDQGWAEKCRCNAAMSTSVK